jgi:hypothetical protein
VSDPNAKKRASGKVVVEGQAGAVVPKATVFHRADGHPFETTAAATIGEDESVKVDVVARVAGVAGQTVPGTILHCKEDPEHFCADCIVDVDGLVIPGAPPATVPSASASAEAEPEVVGAGGAAPRPAATKKGAGAAALARAPDAPVEVPKCFVHLQVNGRGAIRAEATYRGTMKGSKDRHSALVVLTDGKGKFVEHEFEDLAAHDPKNPSYASIEVP